MPPPANSNLIVAIGASAGGFKEIVTIVEGLPQWFAGTLIVATHREPTHENVLADILARRARVRVEEPEDEEHLECTTIYEGHSDETVAVEGAEFFVEVDTSQYARMHRIDDLFTSVARNAGDQGGRWTMSRSIPRRRKVSIHAAACLSRSGPRVRWDRRRDIQLLDGNGTG